MGEVFFAFPSPPLGSPNPGSDRHRGNEREGGRRKGKEKNRKKKPQTNKPPNIHTTRKKEERERSAALAPGLAPRTSNACLICCTEPPHLAPASQSSLRCLPAWPSPSGRPADGKPRASLRLALPTPNYIFGLTKLPCHAGPHASTAPCTGKPRAALSHVRRGARPAGAEGQGGAAPEALPAGRRQPAAESPGGQKAAGSRLSPPLTCPPPPGRALLSAGSAEPGPPGAGALPAPRAGSAAPRLPRPTGAPVTALLRRLPNR